MLWLLMGVSYFAQSQIITIRNLRTGEPVELVTLVSESPKAFSTTNINGQADISAFKNADSIFIRHVSFKELVYSFNQLESKHFIVEMTENNILLNEIIISSNRWSEKKIEIPYRIEKLNMKEVSFQNPQTTADLLGTSGYAFIQKSQMGGGSPMLRGMATNRVLLVVDGVRMNTAVFRSGNLQNVISLDANALESTEILFGPGSIMYGSDAIGGVMDFHTLTPKFSDTNNNNQYTSGNALMRSSTANSEKTEHIDINIGLKKWAFISSFTRAEYGDLRSGSVGGVNYFYRTFYVQTIDNKDYMVPNNDSTLQIGSKYSQTNFMQKVRFKTK